jgi:hypothetical protein
MTTKQPASLSTSLPAELAAQVAQAIAPALAVANTAPVEAAAPAAAVVPRPTLVELNGYTYMVMSAVAHLSRLGYIPFPGIAPQVFANTGQCTVAMVLGSPDAHAVKLAEDAVSYAVAVQERDYQKEVEAAAAKLVETQAQAAKQAALEKEIDEQRNALRRLEAQRA